MKISYRLIGQNIKSARKATGFTQEQIAEHLDISAVHHGRIERVSAVLPSISLQRLPIL